MIAGNVGSAGALGCSCRGERCGSSVCATGVCSSLEAIECDFILLKGIGGACCLDPSSLDSIHSCCSNHGSCVAELRVQISLWVGLNASCVSAAAYRSDCSNGCSGGRSASKDITLSCSCLCAPSGISVYLGCRFGGWTINFQCVAQIIINCASLSLGVGGRRCVGACACSGVSCGTLGALLANMRAYVVGCGGKGSENGSAAWSVHKCLLRSSRSSCELVGQDSIVDGQNPATCLHCATS